MVIKRILLLNLVYVFQIRGVLWGVIDTFPFIFCFSISFITVLRYRYYKLER